MFKKLLLSFAAIAVAPAAFGQLGEWQEHLTGGDTLCARGSPYSFFVHAGASDRVIIDFIGGGACWDAATCDVATATFTDSVDALRQQASEGLHGVYDKANPANPYRDWTHVVVPYCTGDVHWGSADTTYTRANGEHFVIHHRGAANAQAVINWVKANLPSPEKILVTGCSAGSYGSIFYTPLIREDFPDANVRQFGDAGVGVMTPDFMANTLGLWNIGAAAPRWVPGLDPATVDYRHMTLTEFYRRAAAHYPDVAFAQYNSAFDFIQRLFFARMGGDETEWSGGMYRSIDAIHATTPNFSSYIGPGNMHCATVEDDFYGVESGGVGLNSWLTGYVNGQSPADVTCDDCGEP